MSQFPHTHSPPTKTEECLDHALWMLEEAPGGLFKRELVGILVCDKRVSPSLAHSIVDALQHAGRGITATRTKAGLHLQLNAGGGAA